MSRAVLVEGFLADGYAAVAREFQRNFSHRGELGAAFAAVCADRVVVDIWAGTADRVRRRAWREDTLALIFSGTKGLVAICLLMLIDRGALELDAPMSVYWPEFAAADKSAVTVMEVVTHTARLPGIGVSVCGSDLLDDRRMADLLAGQRQCSDPRAARSYHALTYGWLCGELVRRIDGRSIGRFFAEEVAGPLDLEVFIGLPADLQHRVSRLELADTWGTAARFDPHVSERDELMRAVWANPQVWTPQTFIWNDPQIHRAEIPGANAIGTARSVAALYANLERLVSPAVLSLGRSELARMYDPLLEGEHAFGVGFGLQTELSPFGPPADAFGHGGAGGSVHGAWPAHRVAFSYVMNLMRDDGEGVDPRAQALLTTLHQCVEGD
jgi:CubicO group peptidase (beta-lactamase class C family)